MAADLAIMDKKCCMADKYGNWCKDEKTCLIDGKYYCIFHALIENKESFQDNIEERVFEILSQKSSIHTLYNDKEEEEGSLGARECSFKGAIFTKVNLSIPKNIPIQFEIFFEDCVFYDVFLASNTTYTSKICFKKCLFLKHGLFQNSNFEDEINFEWCEFSVENSFSVDFSGTTFTDSVKFSDCLFFGPSFFRLANFSNSKIKAALFPSRIINPTTIIKRCTFYKNSYLEETTFKSELSFTKCTFLGNMNFERSCFQNLLCIDLCNYNKVFKFDYSSFENVAVFNELKPASKKNNCIFSFQKCTFNDALSISDSIFDLLKFNLSTFNSQVNLYYITCHKSLEMDSVVCCGYLSFVSPVYINRLEVMQSTFKQFIHLSNIENSAKINFRGTICEKTILVERVNLKKMTFINTTIEVFKFIECRWKIINNHASIYDSINPHKGVTPLTLEEIYRRLKNNARGNSDEVQTSNWHYKEKEMQRITANKTKILPSVLTTMILAIVSIISFVLYYFTVPKFWAFPPLFVFGIYMCQSYYDDLKDKPHWFSKIYLNLYYFSSRYGESPERASLILICLISSVFFFPFILNSGISSSREWLEFSLWFLPLTKIEINVFNQNILAQMLKVVSFLLITIQSTLLAFSLRNRLRR